MRILACACALASTIALAQGAPGTQDAAPARKLTAAPDRRVELDLQHYYRQSELGVWLGALASAYPEFLRLESIGKSARGDELWVVSVAELSAGDPSSRPALMLVGALGREDLFGTELALATILELVQNHARDEQVASLLRGTTIYVVPCVNPDLRARVFAELEGQPAPAHDGAEVELEHNFPIGWDPAAFERAGAYPLCAPESRALAEFMLGHRNIALVERFARESQRPAAAHTDAPVGDLELARALCASTGAQCVADLGPPRGAWLDFAYGQLGCSAFALVARGASASEVLPPVDALFQMARDAAPRTLRLASALPRIELGEPQVERLRGDQWQVRVAVENSGAMPTLTQLGRERLACPAPTLTLDGGRVLAAAVGEQPVARVAASIALPELAPASACTVTFFVEAPADTELVLTASAPRAGLASVRVAVR